MFGVGYRVSDDMNHATWMDGATIKLKWSLWPRKCYSTGKSIWMTLSYRTRRYFRSGDIDFITEDRWYDKHEFLLLKLRGC